MNWTGCGRKQPYTHLRHSTRSVGTQENHEIIEVRNPGPWGWDLISGRPEYEARVLRTQVRLQVLRSNSELKK
jgi:hypothetical protein